MRKISTSSTLKSSATRSAFSSKDSSRRPADVLSLSFDRQLYKSYLEDFHTFVQSIGAPTSDVMSPILSFEADRRSLNITINSFGTSLSKDQRSNLFPSLGRLYPEGTMALARADDLDQVKQILDPIVEYRAFLDTSSSAGDADNVGGGSVASLEDHFFQHEVHLNKLAFLQQSSLFPPLPLVDPPDPPH